MPRLVPVTLAIVLTAALTAGCGRAQVPAAATARFRITAGIPGRGVLRYRYMTDIPDGTRTRPYGYNLVDLGPYRSLIDALPAGQRALVWIGNYDQATCSFSRSSSEIGRALTGLARDPRVAGYYIADEADDAQPAFGGHCPDVLGQVTARSRLVHRLAPGVFTYEVVAEPSDFAAFAHAPTCWARTRIPAGTTGSATGQRFPGTSRPCVPRTSPGTGGSCKPFPVLDGVIRLPPSCAP